MVKIAFVINFSKKTWNGGFNFFENLIFFLKKYEKKVKIAIITDSKKKIVFRKLLFFQQAQIISKMK